jgi:hypothetical protein
MINTCININLQECDNDTEVHKPLVHMFHNKDMCKPWAKTTTRNSSKIKMHESQH